MQELRSPGELYYELGISLQSVGRYQEAIDALNKCLSDATSTEIPKAIAYLTLGKCYHSINNDWDALKMFDEALKLDPSLLGEIQSEIPTEGLSVLHGKEHASFLEKLGGKLVRWISPVPPPSFHKQVDWLISQQKFEEAEKNLNVILRTWSDDIRALEKLGFVSRQLGKLAGSIDAYKKVINREPRNLQAYLSLSEIYVQAGEYEDAIQAANRVLEIDASSSKALLIRGKAYHHTGALAESERDLRQALQSMPDTYEIYTELADTLGELQQTKEAADVLLQGAKFSLEVDDLTQTYQFCEKAIQLDPKNPLIQELAGLTLHKQGQLEEALKMLERAASLRNSSSTQIEIAQIQFELGNFDDALAALKMAQDLIGPEKKDARALIINGCILHSTGDNPEALRLLDEGLSMDPGQAWGHYQRGHVLEDLDRNGEALDAYREAVKIDPKYQLAFARLGVLLFEEGEMEEALDALNSAISLKKDGPLLTLKGRSEYQLGYYQQAIQTFDETLQLDANDIDANLYRGMSLLATARYEDALNSIQLAIELNEAQGFEGNPAAFSELGETLRMLGRDREAMVALEKAIKLYKKEDREDARTLSRYGAVLVNLSENADDDKITSKYQEDAIKKLKRAVELDQNDSWAWGTLGIAHLNRSNYASALKALGTSIELNSMDYWTWGYKGVVLRIIYRYEEAYQACDEAIRLDPDKAWVLVQKSIALRLENLEKVDSALDLVMQAIRLRPNDASIYIQQAICLYHMQRYDLSFGSLKESIRLDNTNQFASQLRGLLLEKKGLIEEAEKAYSEALKRPLTYKSFLDRAADYAELRAYERAEDDFKHALRIIENEKKESGKPELVLAECLNGLAWFYAEYKNENLELATDMAQRAVDIALGCDDKGAIANCMDTLGWAYFKRGLYQKSTELLKEAFDLNPEDLRIDHHLKLSQNATGKSE